MSNKISKERKKLIKSINDNINEIEIEDRRTILNMIAVVTDREHLYEEGTGIRISYKNIPQLLLEDLDEFITEAKKKTALSF